MYLFCFPIFLLFVVGYGRNVGAAAYLRSLHRQWTKRIFSREVPSYGWQQQETKMPSALDIFKWHRHNHLVVIHSAIFVPLPYYYPSTINIYLHSTSNEAATSPLPNPLLNSNHLFSEFFFHFVCFSLSVLIATPSKWNTIIENIQLWLLPNHHAHNEILR